MPEFEQLVYTWSEASIFGRRGFGVVAASKGWRNLLNGSDDLLGPVVAYPEPGRRGALPPPHGGMALLAGTPVIFRRLPGGSDAMNRPGNYIVHVLLGIEPLSAQLAAGLLGDWLPTTLPAEGPVLPRLELPKPPRRGSAGSSALVCAAVLQGLRDKQQVVIAAPDEETGRAALCDALRRLPAGSADQLTFSTLEAEPHRSGFDVAVTVPDWEVAGPRPGIRVDLATGEGTIDARAARWGETLVLARAESLQGIPEPVTAEAVCTRLDGLAALRDDPRSLTPAALLSVLTCKDGQEWAREPSAPAVVRAVVTGMDPALGPLFARAAARRPAVSGLLEQVGWDVLTGTAGANSRRTAEAMLLGLGKSQTDIDLAVLSTEPSKPLTPEDSERLLRLLDEKGAALNAAAAAKVTWTEALAARYPRRWLDAALLQQSYRGPVATRRILAAVGPSALGGVLARGRESVDEAVLAERLWALLPRSRRDQVAYLRLIGASGGLGLRLLSERLLSQPALDRRVRDEVLGAFWPVLVGSLRLPAYLGEALAPRKPSNAGLVLAGLALVALIVWGVLLIL